MHAYAWQEGWRVQYCKACVEEEDEGGGYDEWDV